MAAPPNFEEGQSTNRPPIFNGQYYGWWKIRMHDFIMFEDSELWDIICDGPYVPTKVLEELRFSISKTSKEYTDADRKAMEMNFCAKKILQEFSKNNPEKAAKRNLVPFKDFKRKRSADNVMKHALAAWGDSSSESEDETDIGDSSMMAVEGEENEYDSTFALMVQLNDDEDSDNKEVNFRDVQRNLKSYSSKKLISLDSVLINAYHKLVEDREFLTLELGESEQTRDDLVVVVIDHKKTIENVNEERNDLLAVIADLRETIERPETNSKPENPGKGKEIASEEHIRLKNKLKAARVQSVQKFKVFAEKVTTKEGPGSTHKKRTLLACTKRALIHPLDYYKGPKLAWHRNGNTMDFLSLKALQGGSVSFGNGKKGNKVEFLSKICTITDLVTGEVVLVAKRYKNIYVVDFESLQSGDLSFLKAVDDDAELWHRRLGHIGFSLLNKLIQKDQVHGLPMSKFKVEKICDACTRGKHVKSSFKSNRDVSTSKLLEFLHMDLCGPMRLQSRGGKRYIFVIVDDYSRFTWTLFLRTKNETFKVFVAFVKKIRVKMESRVACIRSDHGTKFDNAKFDEFCNENGITHNFSARRTPQQNGVVERKNRTLEEMARTMLIDIGIAKNFWAEAVNTACYLVNRCMIRSLMNKTPYELLNGRKPKLTHLRTFGCKCYVLNNGKDQLGKFDAKSDEGIFMRYSSQSKAYKIYNKRT
ncbi:uncharacterized protein [Nicotiana sylvestris]|uniref:uncharacterized protein n=1 Tax=Nicotiana sylvestris TaxID=4096 RepID=UPI00388C87A7